MVNLNKTILFVIICLIILVSCIRKTSTNAKKESFALVKQSEAQIYSGNFDNAEILIEKALELYPNNYIAFNDRAFIKRKKGKPPREVISDYKKALEIWPQYIIGTYSLANYYLEIKDYNNAIVYANRYLSFQLNDNLDFFQLGHIYFVLAKSEESTLQFSRAIIDFKKSVTILPGDKFMHYNLGECYYYGNNDMENALAEFTIALKIDSTYYQAYTEREKCDRNIHPPLLAQAFTDSINSYKYDTSRVQQTDSLNKIFENYRRSLDPKIAAAFTYYQAVSSMYEPSKIQFQKLIDLLRLDLQFLKNNDAYIDINYLQKLTDSTTAAISFLLKKLDAIVEVDGTIDCKNKLKEYETINRSLLDHEIPELIKLLRSQNQNKFSEAVHILMPKMVIIRQKSIEFKNAEDALFLKYSLH